MIAQIHWKNKRVLIVGNGKQGKRKKAQFEQEGAIVLVKDRAFQEADLEGADLVYACTSDREFNQQLVQMANARGIFSANIHQDSQATFHACQEKNFDQLAFGFTSHGTYPLYLEVIKEDLTDLYQNKWEDQLRLLAPFRKRLMGRKDLMKLLVGFSAGNLKWLEKACQTKEGIALVFASGEKVDTLLDAWLESRYGFLYFDEHFEKWIELFDCLKIKMSFQPMFVYPGHLFKRFKKLGLSSFSLLHSTEWKKILASYDREGTVFVVHPSKKDGLKHWLQTLLKEGTVIDLNEALEEDAQRIFPFFVLNRKHVREDVPALDSDIPWCCFCLLDLEAFRKQIELHIESEKENA